MAVHDLRIQAEAKDLVLGTHGRSIYKTNIAMLQEMTSEKLNEDLVLFSLEKVNYSPRWGTSWNSWRDPIEPSAAISLYAGKTGTATITVKSPKGATLYSNTLDVEKGFQNYKYDLTLTEKGRNAYLKENKDASIEKKQNGKHYLPKGTFTVEVDLNGVKKAKELVVD